MKKMIRMPTCRSGQSFLDSHRAGMQARVGLLACASHAALAHCVGHSARQHALGEDADDDCHRDEEYVPLERVVRHQGVCEVAVLAVVRVAVFTGDLEVRLLYAHA